MFGAREDIAPPSQSATHFPVHSAVIISFTFLSGIGTVFKSSVCILSLERLKLLRNVSLTADAMNEC